MFRIIKSFLLLALVVVTITGAFFFTRGCGTIDDSAITFKTLKDQRKRLGPILAKKDRQLEFFPGDWVWKKISEQSANWRDQAAELIAEKVFTAIDTLLDMQKIPLDDLNALIDSSIKAKLDKMELQNILEGSDSFSLDVDELLSKYSDHLKDEYKAKVDSMIEKIPELKDIPKGNF